MDRERKSAKVLTAKICGREKSYGNFLYIHLPRDVERRIGWQKGDLVQLILDEKRDLVVLKRVFRVSEALASDASGSVV